MAEIAAHEEEELDEEHSDADEEDEDGDSEEEVEGEGAETAETPEPTPATTAEPPSLESLSLADQPPHPPTSDPEHDQDPAAANDDDDSDSNSDAESTGSLAPSMADTLSHRRHRPSARRVAPDVTAIVTNKLAKNKASSERKHHGKKQATSNVLGRNKGSKAKQSQTRAIKDGGDF